MSDSSSSDDNIDTLARLAAERPPDDRAAFLKDLCPDEQTRRAVWERLCELFPQNNETDADDSSDDLFAPRIKRPTASDPGRFERSSAPTRWATRTSPRGTTSPTTSPPPSKRPSSSPATH